jgi:alpha-L-fucosidase 2
MRSKNDSKDGDSMSTLSRRQILAAGPNIVAAGHLRKLASLMHLAGAATESTPAGAPPIAFENTRLWYRQPAEEWVEALPIGNGRLGGMLFGGVERDRIQLNEGTIWAGGPHVYDNPEALAALPEIRRLIFSGKIEEAQKLADQKFMSKPLGQLQYQTAGELELEFLPGETPVSEYQRELNIESAIHTVKYEQDGCWRQREAFASFPINVIAVQLTTNSPSGLNFEAKFKSPQKSEVAIHGQDLWLSGISSESEGIPGQVKFIAGLRILTNGGVVSKLYDSIHVEGTHEATLLISLATNVLNYKDLSGDPDAIVKKHLDDAAAKSYATLRTEHLDDHRRLFGRVNLNLETPRTEGSTEERIEAFQRGDDPSLAELYFNYGRYLMISCSRIGGKAATLQGLWNDSMSPPWGSKYTTNINTEMNYWPVETCGLAECHEPLFDLIHDISITGANTAKVHYGARGWVLHHNTDQWRGTAPIDGAAWGIWPTGGAWLSTHLWQHYLFNRDRKTLQRHYPLMRGAALFFVDTLVPDPDRGWLVTCPSASPENSHHPGQGLCAGPTMDIQIIRDLFEACIDASKVLDIDAEFREELSTMRARLAPMQVGRHGQLQEWLDDWDEFAPEQHHRHVSHLYGLFPSHQINPTDTPELFAAAKKSLEIRGDDGTGWSLAWKINLWARLLDGDHAIKLVKDALRPVGGGGISYGGGGGVFPNLFDAHPPFQIDGNFGFTSGVAEMLLQSRLDDLHLLPALPTLWHAGEVKGLRARGGYEVAMRWRSGRLLEAEVLSHHGGQAKIRYDGSVQELSFGKGQKHTLAFKSA